VASIRHLTNIINSSLLTIHSDKDIKKFTKGVVVKDPPPQMKTGAEVHAQIDALVANQEGGGFVGYSGGTHVDS
jgi:hypothetical protein